jgi:hypothetical protein
MRKCIIVGLAVLTMLGGQVAETRANSPFTLYYAIDDNGDGTYSYGFYLVLDNNNGSWSPGQGFDWLIFGDFQSMPSPFSDFVMYDGVFPVGPWTQLQGTGGYHNGPTLGPIYDPIAMKYVTWVPEEVGDSLSWFGVSSVYLDQGQMLFSSLYTEGGAHIFEFEVAILVQ